MAENNRAYREQCQARQTNVESLLRIGAQQPQEFFTVSPPSKRGREKKRKKTKKLQTKRLL